MIGLVNREGSRCWRRRLEIGLFVAMSVAISSEVEGILLILFVSDPCNDPWRQPDGTGREQNAPLRFSLTSVDITEL